MVFKLLLLAVVAHLGMAAVDLPALWGRKEQRGELWTVIGLLVMGFALSAFIILGYTPFDIFGAVEALFKPVGTLLFKVKGA